MGSKKTAKSSDAGSRLSELCETGSAILEALDLQDILSIVTERTRLLFEGSGAAVTFLDAEALELWVAGASGSLEGVKGARYPVEGTLSRRGDSTRIVRSSKTTCLKSRSTRPSCWILGSLGRSWSCLCVSDRERWAA